VLLRACNALGIAHPRAYRAVLELPQLFLHAWMLLAVYGYCRRRVDERWAYLGVLMVGLYGLVVAFAGRTLGESLSTAFFVIGVEALDRSEKQVRAGLLGGAAMGLSVVARYGSAVLVAAALLWLLGARAWKRLLFAGIAGGAVAVGLGILDWVTWKEAFHSFIAYTRFNVLSGAAAAQFGREPVLYYASWLFEYAPLWVWPGLWVAVRKQRPRLPLPLFCAVAYTVAVSATAHKEARFLYPGLVLFGMAAAPGILRFLLDLRRPDLRQSLAALALVAGAATFFFPGELQAQRSDEFRALIEAGHAPDTTGLLIVNDGLWGVGGYFYLGKNIPWTNCDNATDGIFQMAMQDARINRVVTYADRALPELQGAGFKIVDRIGYTTVLRR